MMHFMDSHAGTEQKSLLAISLNHGSLFQCLLQPDKGQPN